MSDGTRRLLLLGLELAVALVPLRLTAETPAAAPAQPQAQAAPAVRTVSVLPSTDTSGLNLAGPLQTALGRLFQQLGGVRVQLSPYALGGFTAPDIRRLHETLGSELLTFVYLEKDRLALFLFDAGRPGQFVVASESLTDAKGTPVLTSEWIEHQFRAGFVQLIQEYSQGKLQPLPGTRVDSESLAQEENDEAQRRAAESRRLFRELSSLEDRPYYVGASIGMTRFSGESAASSTVDFGAYGGLKVAEALRLELGADLFNYATLHFDARYHLPIAEKYISLALSLGVARVLTPISLSSLSDSAGLKVGQTMFGPGLSLDIPLLGTVIRGDLRFYIGNGSMLVGTYGLAYSL